MNSIFNYRLKELEDILVASGFKKYNASQIFDFVYRKKVFDFMNITNLSKETREYLSNNFEISFPKVIKLEVSKDKTRKYLFEFNDLSKVEAVLMYQPYGISICLSSQVGCNMGCKFCASGLNKKERNLEASEMVSMLLSIEEDIKEKITHIVIMGTGEPLDNFQNVTKFIEIVNAPKGLEIGIRHITLSTCGLVDKIDELAKLNLGINLAISLHAPTDDLRNKLMPINKKYPIKSLLDACVRYFNTTSRRITFEYLLLDNVNDSSLFADKLADILKGINCYVNLIPYNNVKEFDFKTTKEETQNNFFNILKKRGINVTLRRKMGDDINSACGQLRSETIKNNK